MIKELCDLGQIKKKEEMKKFDDDCFIKDKINTYLIISETGEFVDFILKLDRDSIVEDVVRYEDAGRTSGILPRMLVDNEQYLLGYPKEKERSKNCLIEYLKKIDPIISNIDELKPIKHFYYDNKKDGLRKAYKKFDSMSKNDKKLKLGNIAFLKEGDNKPLHEYDKVYSELKNQYKILEKDRKGNNSQKCTICNSTKYRVNNVATHGVVKRVPDGQSSGNYLISYNAESYKSYGLDGNNNSQVCTNCCKNYTYALNWLLANGDEINVGNKSDFRYTNRKKIGKDTAIVYWLKSNKPVQEIDYIENPEDVDILDLINDNIKFKNNAQLSDVNQTLYSPAKGKKHISDNLQTDFFYSITLSGAAARIAVRDWMSLTLDQLKNNIAHYFKDIGIINYSKASSSVIYPSINRLAWGCAVHKKSEKNGTVMYGIDFDDVSISRTGAQLWKTALQGAIPPLNILDKVLRRIKTEEGRIDASRAALIKLVINRNNKGGQQNMKEQLDKENKSTAYISGRIFAVMESIQRAALGDSVNAGIRERFFASASTTPATAFGRLFRMCQQHLTKLKSDKKGLVVFFDKQLGELMIKIDVLPAMFSLEEQGQFAVGYYHQKQDIFMQAQKNKDLKDAIETDVEIIAGGKK